MTDEQLKAAGFTDTGSWKVESIDNRGDQDNPYGYVYFEHTRVGFAIDVRFGWELVVFATRPAGYWPTPTARQFTEAKKALVKAKLAKSINDIRRM